MGILHPALLLLLLPAGVAWWRLRDRGRTTAVLRAVVLVVLVLALAMPYLSTTADGRDLVVVVDRSRSMPAEAATAAGEIIALAENARREGDRVGVVSFGARAAIERLPLSEGRFGGFAREVSPDGSDLGEALAAALQLIPDGRRGSIVVLSDGEENGRDPLDAARRAFARGVRIDVRPFIRPPTADLAVELMDLPPRVDVGEPFQFAVWVHADRRVTSHFRLRRGDTVISAGRRVFERGRNRLLFRDVLPRAGIADYRVEVELEGDRIPENNRGRGAVTAVGARPLLVVNDDGAVDTLVHALRVSGMAVDVARPEDLRLDAVTLSRWRAVVLENVAARRFDSSGLAALAELVVERGGGLLMTGGRASYGVGGWHLTPVDEVLPVSMELRQEHRKQGVAMAIVMDRSGSMGMPVAGGQTKMDLANLGAVAAVELLSAIDSVGVIAVDSTPHVVQPLARVDDPQMLGGTILRTEAGGGGIYVRTGLEAAATMLEGASQANRHVILFADAADSEEKTGVVALVEQLGEAGTSVSVIALGTEGDPDAGFLHQVAAAGGGEIYFSTDARELPRMFAQDTLTVARSSFIEEPTAVELLPDLRGLGELDPPPFPTIAGYNLNYLREGAAPGAITGDEYRAPIFAFHHRGLGRTAAFCAQVGGTHGRAVVEWPACSAFFVTAARWLVGQEEPADLFPTVRREGTRAIVAVEVDPESPTPPDTSHLVARLRSPAGAWSDHVLERVGEHLFEARVPLLEEGILIGTVRLGEDRFVTLPPVALPYSPEFARVADPEAGGGLLRRLARETGGEVSPAAHTLLRGPRDATTHRVVSRELALAALLLLLLEIAGRRLGLWGALRLPRRPAAVLGGLARNLRGTRRIPAPAEAMPSLEEGSAPPPAGPAPPPKPPRRRPPGNSLTDTLDTARARARRRLED